jgi:hypothetical protein
VPFPYEIDDVLKPLADVVGQLLAGEKRVWTGVGLGKPVAHIVPQPQVKLDRPDRTQAERINDIVELAFQLGVCQGYAIAQKENRYTETLRKAIEEIHAIGEAQSQAPKE